MLKEMYGTAANDPGLRAAAEWLLRHWQQGKWLTEFDLALAGDEKLREKQIEAIHREWASVAKRSQECRAGTSTAGDLKPWWPLAARFSRVHDGIAGD